MSRGYVNKRLCVSDLNEIIVSSWILNVCIIQISLLHECLIVSELVYICNPT